MTPLLSRLEVENAFESESMFEALPRQVPFLRRLAVRSHTALRDSSKHLAGLQKLTRLEVDHSPLIVEDLASGAMPPNLRWFSLRFGLPLMSDSVLAGLMRNPLLVALSIPRTALSLAQLVMLQSSNIVFLSFAAETMDDEKVNALRGIPNLQRASVMHPLTSTVFPVPFPPFLWGMAHWRVSTSVQLSTDAAVSEVLMDNCAEWAQIDVKKEKFAFCVYWHDEFSLLQMMEIAHRGFNMIVAVLPATSSQTKLQPQMEERIMGLLRNSVSFHFHDFSNGDTLELRKFVSGITTSLHVVSLIFPIDVGNSVSKDLLHAMQSVSATTDSSVWHMFYEWIAAKPLTTLAALAPLLERVPGARVGFFGSPLTSISENVSGGFYFLRAAFAALAAAVRSLSFGLKEGIVLAIFPGTFLPGSNSMSQLSPKDAAHNFLTTLFLAEQKHSGRVVRYTMECLKE